MTAQYVSSFSSYNEKLKILGKMTSGANKSSKFKVVLLGEGCVGKTSIVLRYCENKFNEKHLTTLQVCCLYLTFPLKCVSIG